MNNSWSAPAATDIIFPLRPLRVPDARDSDIPETDVLAKSSYAEAFDRLLRYALSHSRDGVGSALALADIATDIADSTRSDGSLIQAATLVIETYMLLDNGADNTEAETTLAEALTLLTDIKSRREPTFQSLLATALYLLAVIRVRQGQVAGAGRAADKSLALFDSLATAHPELYTSAHVHAIALAASINRSGITQRSSLALAREQVAAHLAAMRDGDSEATSSAIDALGQAGHTLLSLGRQREAVQYLSRALKLIRHGDNESGDPRTLPLSVDLAIALVETPATRGKGIHLLNTLLHIATRQDRHDQYLRVRAALDRTAAQPSLRILDIWYKIFPK